MPLLCRVENRECHPFALTSNFGQKCSTNLSGSLGSRLSRCGQAASSGACRHVRRCGREDRPSAPRGGWRLASELPRLLGSLEVWGRNGTLALPDRRRPAAGGRSMDVGRAWRELWCKRSKAVSSLPITFSAFVNTEQSGNRGSVIEQICGPINTQSGRSLSPIPAGTRLYLELYSIQKAVHIHPVSRLVGAGNSSPPRSRMQRWRERAHLTQQ